MAMDNPNLKEATATVAPRLVPLAPAANQSGDGSTGKSEPELMPYTCVTCSRRKVKCDKTQPCSACRRGHLECIYQAPAPRKRKRRIEDASEKLDRYARILRENGLLPDEDAEDQLAENGSQSGLASLGGSIDRKARPVRTGTLIKSHGKTRYVDSQVWRSLGDDLHPSSDEDDDGLDRAGSATELYSEPMDPATLAFLESTHHRRDLLSLHPTYDNAMKLWQLFVQNVDPIIKIIHAPSVVQLLQRSASNPSQMSKATECLLFSIYHFAMVTIDERQSQELFRLPCAVLEKRYHDAAKQALVNCQFLRTVDMTVLQAFFLYLLSVRHVHDAHSFWILTGVAVRIAQRIGLHRDGIDLGLCAFDVQMRRRLFWQLIPLDHLAAQLSGTGIAVSGDSWDTKQPLNLNDEDIWPGMDTEPTERKGPTDMMFCIARTEIGKAYHNSRVAMTKWVTTCDASALPEIEAILQEMENNMEEKYIRYCDISNPVHCLTIAMARAALASVRMRVRLPRARMMGATLDDRRELYNLSMKVLDHDIAIHNNASLSGFYWHMHNFFRWEPLMWILNECRHEEPIFDVEQCWQKIEMIYNKHPEMILQKRTVDIGVSRATLRSWEVTQRRRKQPLLDPPFIASLRQSLRKRDQSRHGAEASENASPITNTSSTPAALSSDRTPQTTTSSTQPAYHNGSVYLSPQESQSNFTRQPTNGNHQWRPPHSNQISPNPNFTSIPSTSQSPYAPSNILEQPQSHSFFDPHNFTTTAVGNSNFTPFDAGGDWNADLDWMLWDNVFQQTNVLPVMSGSETQRVNESNGNGAGAGTNG